MGPLTIMIRSTLASRNGSLTEGGSDNHSSDIQTNSEIERSQLNSYLFYDLSACVIIYLTPFFCCVGTCNRGACFAREVTLQPEIDERIIDIKPSGRTTDGRGLTRRVIDP